MSKDRNNIRLFIFVTAFYWLQQL